MDPSGVYPHLNALFSAGVLTRRRDCRKYRYSVVPGMYIESDTTRIPTKNLYCVPKKSSRLRTS